jgi:hypothetical protein
LPKYWSYDINQKVRINSTSSDLFHHKGIHGQIIHLHEGILFDYDVILDTGEVVRVRESEINSVKE